MSDCGRMTTFYLLKIFLLDLCHLLPLLVPIIVDHGSLQRLRYFLFLLPTHAIGDRIVLLLWKIFPSYGLVLR